MEEKVHGIKKQQRHIMWRELFTRVIWCVTLILVIGLSIMGYSINRVKQDYYDISEKTCDELVSIYLENSDTEETDLIQDTTLLNALQQTANNFSARAYLFDGEGNCIFCTEDTPDTEREQTLSSEMQQALDEEGTYFSDSDTEAVSGANGEPMLCKGYKIIKNIAGIDTTYYFLVNMQMDTLNAMTSDVIVFVVILMVGLVVFSFLVIYGTLYFQAKKQNQLLESLRRYAQGDYTQPIDIEKYADTNMEEVAVLTEQISKASRRAEEASRQFVSNVSHELRTPMTIISGFVNNMIDGTIPKIKRMEYLNIISQEMHRLKMLVNSMLNLTKFDSGTIQLNRSRFAWNDLIFHTLLMFESRLEKKEIQIEGLDSDSVRIYADYDLIGQVVYNLIENAVKFVDKGGTITFSFEETNEEWHFSIRNTGKGVPSEELPKLFERFYKSDFSRSEDKTGLGLGLDISRRIVYLHGGHMSVASEEDAYTEFSVILPKVEAPKQDGKKKEKHSTEESK